MPGGPFLRDSTPPNKNGRRIFTVKPEKVKKGEKKERFFRAIPEINRILGMAHLFRLI
jgi:hypothetical protein